MDLALHYAVEVAAGLTITVLSAVGAWLYRGQKDRRRVGEAPFLFVKRLDELILRAMREGPGSAHINARAIVAARNSMVSSAVGISSSLNSEIDRLARDLEEPQLLPAVFVTGEEPEDEEEFGPSASFGPAVRRASRARRSPQRGGEWQTIQVLARIWPAKRTEVIVQVRKMLAELNIPFDSRHEDNFEGYWEKQPIVGPADQL